jgi:hypothetical protein
MRDLHSHFLLSTSNFATRDFSFCGNYRKGKLPEDCSVRPSKGLVASPAENMTWTLVTVPYANFICRDEKPHYDNKNMFGRIEALKMVAHQAQLLNSQFLIATASWYGPSCSVLF